MNTPKNRIIIYQKKSGAIAFRGDVRKETLWATQAQIADVFESERSVITKHIQNIFRDGELSKDSVRAKFAHTAKDGKTYQVAHYNLDLILSVGYRVNSKRATVFRQWATKVLREHLTKGYTINRSQIAKNYEAFLCSVEDIKKLLPQEKDIDAKGVLDLVRMFASTWLSLDAYDRSDFPTKGATKKHVRITADELTQALIKLKQELIDKGEATEIFGQERARNALEGIVGNIFQSVGGKDVYPTVEEKVVHLLYFIVKDHPFTDGNKRSGAFAFVWFLEQAKILNARITPEALTTITLLVAESDPKDKDRMIGLVLAILGGTK